MLEVEQGVPVAVLITALDVKVSRLSCCGSAPAWSSDSALAGDRVLG